jgi:hypothetical protein
MRGQGGQGRAPLWGCATLSRTALRQVSALKAMPRKRASSHPCEARGEETALSVLFDIAYLQIDVALILMSIRAEADGCVFAKPSHSCFLPLLATMPVPTASAQGLVLVDYAKRGRYWRSESALATMAVGTNREDAFGCITVGFVINRG